MTDNPEPVRITPASPGDEIWTSGWGRWLPSLAVFLYVRIAEGEDISEFSDDEPVLDDDDKDQIVPDSERIRRLREATGMEIETLGDCLRLLERLRLIQLVDDAWLANEKIGTLPEDVLVLSDAEQRSEDEMRWAALHAPAREVLIKLFAWAHLKGEERPLNHSLTSLSQVVGYDTLVLREAFAELVQDGDFKSSRDIATVDDDEPFEVSVDWDRFNELRLSPAELLGLAGPTSPETFPSGSPDDRPEA